MALSLRAKRGGGEDVPIAVEIEVAVPYPVMG